VHDPESGRVLEIFTTEPGIQFYGGNFLDGSDTGKEGKPYEHRTAFCLEPQHFPDSPNQPEFPSVVIDAFQPFRSETIYRFTCN
jgi:aldose 1-epimerase